MATTASPTRRTQQRALETRATLLDAATDAFSSRGFAGVSVRQLEEAAGVNRGLVAYHFDDKDGIWKAVVDRLFQGMADAFGERLLVLAEVAPTESARALVRAFVRYSAEHPELNRLMMQECMTASWRVDYIVERHVRPQLNALERAVPEASRLIQGLHDPHRYYMFIGASAFVFSAEHECRGLFGVSPRTPEFIEQHVERVTALLIDNQGDRSDRMGEYDEGEQHG